MCALTAPSSHFDSLFFGASSVCVCENAPCELMLQKEKRGYLFTLLELVGALGTGDVR